MPQNPFQMFADEHEVYKRDFVLWSGDGLRKRRIKPFAFVPNWSSLGPERERLGTIPVTPTLNGA